MKKFIFPALVIGALVITYFASDRERTPPLQSTKEELASPAQTKKRLPLKQVKYIALSPLQTSSLFPIECSNQLADLSSMIAADYTSLVQSDKSLEDFFGPNCFVLLKANKTFQQLLGSFQCDLEKVGEKCVSTLILLKAYFIAEQSAHKNLEDLSAEELAAHVAAMFFKLGELNVEEFAKNQKYIQALYQLYPLDPDIMEAYLGYLMIGGKISGTSVDELVHRLMQEQEGVSFKVDRLQVFRELLNGDLDGAKSVLEALNDRYPNEPELAYYQAAYYWKRGNREMANSYLDRAISLGTNCTVCTPELYRETKKRIKTAKKGDQNLFSLSIGLNFENI